MKILPILILLSFGAYSKPNSQEAMEKCKAVIASWSHTETNTTGEGYDVIHAQWRAVEEALTHVSDKYYNLYKLDFNLTSEWAEIRENLIRQTPKLQRFKERWENYKKQLAHYKEELDKAIKIRDQAIENVIEQSPELKNLKERLETAERKQEKAEKDEYRAYYIYISFQKDMPEQSPGLKLLREEWEESKREWEEAKEEHNKLKEEWNKAMKLIDESPELQTLMEKIKEADRTHTDFFIKNNRFFLDYNNAVNNMLEQSPRVRQILQDRQNLDFEQIHGGQFNAGVKKDLSISIGRTYQKLLKVAEQFPELQPLKEKVKRAREIWNNAVGHLPKQYPVMIRARERWEKAEEELEEVLREIVNQSPALKLAKERLNKMEEAGERAAQGEIIYLD